jgi:prevent-host-death family protein
MIMISRTELARNTRKVIEQVRKGQPVLVESYGEEQVAILDAIDFRLVQAFIRYRPDRNAAVEHNGLTHAELQELVEQAGGDVQVWWDRVVAAHQDNAISLGRAAELLNTNRFVLTERYNRLGIPLQLGPRTIEEAIAEVEALRS